MRQETRDKRQETSVRRRGQAPHRAGPFASHNAPAHTSQINQDAGNRQNIIRRAKRLGVARPDLVSGQVMLMAMLSLAGTVVGATTIAGLLMVYQIRQSTDFARSAQAIFTADAGVEWALYQYFKPGSTAIDAPVFPSNVSLDLRCYDTVTDPATPILCTDQAVNLIQSAGVSYGARRIFELDLGP